MHTAARFLTTIFFFLFISVPLVLWASGVGTQSTENRAPSDFPELRVERVFDTDMYEELGDYLRDRAPLRNEAVELEAKIDVEVFSDSPSKEVYVGEDGWLFYDRPFRLPCESQVPVSDLVERLVTFTDIVADSGRTVLVLVAPDKPAIYSDRLTDELVRLGACSAQKRGALRAALDAVSPTGYLDMWSALETQRALGLEVFFSNDTHWNSRAVLLAVKAIVDSLDQGLWDPAAVAITAAQHEGDLTRLMSLPSSIPTDRHRIRRPGVTVQRTEIPVVGGPPFRRSVATGDVALHEGALVVLHDSFFNESISMFQQYFAEAAILNWNSVTPDDIKEAIASSDVVVLELVERSFYRLIDTVIGSDELLAMLREQLEFPSE